VHQNSIQYKTDSKSDVSALCRIPPHLKLEPMSSKGVSVFSLVEPHLFLHVVSAVIVVEQQVMHGRSREDRAGNIEFGLPNVVAYLLGIGVLK